MGETDPAKSLPGTIRGDFSIHVWPSYDTFTMNLIYFKFWNYNQIGRNIIHGSDSVAAAEREIKIWFKSEELTDWKSSQEGWLYEWC